MKYLSPQLALLFIFSLLVGCDHLVTDMSMPNDIIEIEKAVISLQGKAVVTSTKQIAQGRFVIPMGTSSDMYSISFVTVKGTTITLNEKNYSFCCNTLDSNCTTLVHSNDMNQNQFGLCGHNVGDTKLVFELYYSQKLVFRACPISVRVGGSVDFPYNDVP